VGILGIGGISFARFIQSMKQTQPGNTVLTAASPTHVAKPAPTHGTQRKPVAPRAQPSPAKTAQPTPKPQPPQPTPTPPAHTGTVIGSTKLPINSSKDFINPADGNNSLLIHLPNGNFVACERACTHEGVPVYYDNGSQQLVCPAHNAIFDPANNFSVVQGPAQTPLPGVSIRVNADGTITTG
jgi:Rieske Fe-S protein